MAKKPTSAESARSAKTGKFVTEGYAKKHPSTTVVERKTAAKPAAKAAAKPEAKRPAASGKPDGSDAGKKKR